MPSCPNCQASLDDDLIASTGVAECPFCGTQLSDADLGLTADDSDAHTTAATGSAAANDIPEFSRIRVIESNDRQLVIFVPPGGRAARFLGFFALAWNGFMVMFTTIWVVAEAGPEADSLVFLYLMLGLFWLVGIAALVIWLRMAFTRIFLLLQRDRLTLQRILFGRKSIKDTYLDSDSRAELVESYQQNDVPVYKIVVNGTNRSASFGTALAREDKAWLAKTINDFLDADSMATDDA